MLRYTSSNKLTQGKSQRVPQIYIIKKGTDIGTWLSIGQLTQTNAKVHKLQQIDQRKM